MNMYPQYTAFRMLLYSLVSSPSPSSCSTLIANYIIGKDAYLIEKAELYFTNKTTKINILPSLITQKKSLITADNRNCHT